MQLPAMLISFAEFRSMGFRFNWMLALDARNFRCICMSLLQLLQRISFSSGGTTFIWQLLAMGLGDLQSFFWGSPPQLLGRTFDVSKPGFRLFPDGPPLQLAEQGLVLHQQILLPTARLIGNLNFALMPPLDNLHVGYDVALLQFGHWKQRGGCTSECGPVPAELLFGPVSSLASLHGEDSNLGSTQPHSSTLVSPAVSVLSALPGALGMWWKQLIQAAYEWLFTAFLWGGDVAASFFRTLCMACLIYQCRLLAFALRLKGGTCNLDPLVLGLRAACKGAGWKWGLPLAQFSPCQTDACTQPRKRRRGGCRFALSRDLFLLMLIFFSLFGEASAGSGRSDGLDPTGFRARRRAPKRCGSLMDLRHVARNLDSPTSDSEPDEQYITYYFRIFGVGMWSEAMVQEFRAGTGIRAALEFLEADSQIGQLSPPGHLAPVRGIPRHDYVAAIWAPAWTQNAPGATILIDTSLIGKEPFALWYPYRHISLDLLQEQLSDLWEPGIYAFSLYHTQQPLTETSPFLVRDGTAICLQYDALPQFAYRSEFEAFSSFTFWGANMAERDDPPDLQWDVSHVQLTHSDATQLISVGLEELTWQTLRTIAHRFTEGPGDITLQLAKVIPARYTFSGVPVSHLVFSSAELPLDGVIVIFLNLRGIGWDGRAVVLQWRRYHADELLTALGLHVPEVPGYRVCISGGRRRGGRWTFQDGDVVSLGYLPNGAPEPSESSESELPFSDDHEEDTDNDLPDHEVPELEDREPCGTEQASSSSGSGSCPAAGHASAGSGHNEGTAVFTSSTCMWNGAECHDDLSRGKHGDTSIGELECSDLFPQGSDLALRYNAAHRKIPSKTLRCASFPGLQWGLLGIVLYCQCVLAVGMVQGTIAPAALLPILDDTDFSQHLCDLCDTHLRVLTLPGSHSSATSDEWHLSEFAAEDPVARLCAECGDIVTALEDGKGGTFHSTCAELGWFLAQFHVRLAEGCFPSSSDGCSDIQDDGVASPTGKTPLNLFESLQLDKHPVGRISSRSDTLVLPESWTLPEVLFQTWDGFDLIADVSDWSLHDCSLAALRWANPFVWSQSKEWDLHLYTDGSAKDAQAGWAVVIVAISPSTGCCSFLGCFGGRLGDSADLGSSDNNALQAEQAALCWACLWTLPQISFLSLAFKRILFCWDSIAAGLGASGDCSPADTPLARFLEASSS